MQEKPSEEPLNPVPDATPTAAEPDAPRKKLRIKRRVKRRIKRTLTALGKRNPRFREISRAAIEMKRQANYRGHLRRNEVDDRVVVFESFMGRSYSCSPKALYRAMLADPRFADYTFVWAFKKPGHYAENPELSRAELVRYGSQQYYSAYAKAKYWISNSRIPGHITRRPEQVYVQAWHGTPLKRIGCDIEQGENALHSVTQLHDLYRNEGSRASFLLSPSRFASEKFTTAFDLAALGREEIVVEEGYPRNDVLSSFSADDVARVKAEMEIPQDKRVVLYAPTWRDDQHVTGVGYTYDVSVDLDRLREDLGDGYIILFRAHYFVASTLDLGRYEGFVRDVSQVDDINDLYIVSDALVTDYSSVFFDYANLNRPIIFYMYDLERYRQNIRGFYLSLDELPGPVVLTEKELVAALRESELPSADALERLRLFNERFTYLDDGHASDRVLARVFGPEPASTTSGDQKP